VEERKWIQTEWRIVRGRGWVVKGRGCHEGWEATLGAELHGRTWLLKIKCSIGQALSVKELKSTRGEITSTNARVTL
jgi:hypothetical protein